MTGRTVTVLDLTSQAVTGLTGSAPDRDELRQRLLTEDEHFAALATEHAAHEARLSELRDLTHPTVDEEVEEKTLKKKKLVLKDEMEAILLRHAPDG